MVVVKRPKEYTPERKTDRVKVRERVPENKHSPGISAVIVDFMCFAPNDETEAVFAFMLQNLSLSYRCGDHRASTEWDRKIRLTKMRPQETHVKDKGFLCLVYIL